MKKSKHIITGIIYISIFISSCKKEHHHEDISPESVNINILTPQQLQEYEVGDTVWMKVKITSPTELHGYELHITRLADTTEVYDFDKDLHQSNFDISQYWINDGSKHSDMTLEVIANIDHSGNKASKKVQFHCHAQ